MKFRFAYLLLAAVLMVSCERKLRPPDIAGSGTAGLIGKWNLVSTGGFTTASTETDVFGVKFRAESKLTYTSSNPKGFYDFTSTELKSVNIGYDYSGIMNVKVYQDNVLQTDLDTPIPSTPIGPLSQSTTYKLVGADSIAFLNQPPVVIQGASGTFTPPNGCKYKIEGNKLTMTMKFGSTTTNNSGGVISVDKISADVNIILQKQ